VGKSKSVAPRRTCKYGHEYPNRRTTVGAKRICPTCRAAKVPRLCSVNGCERPHNMRGFCILHLRRVEKYGVPTLPPTPSVAERFWSKVDKDGPISTVEPELGKCWTWTAEPSFHDSERSLHPRRWAWVDAYGKPPADAPLIVSRCRNDQCVNPAHHFAGTKRDIGRTNFWGGRERCVRGHLLAGENIQLKANGQRVCRACRRLRALEWRTANPDLQAKRSLRAYLRKAGNLDGLEYLDILKCDPCVYCGAPSEAIDHIKPISRGGDSHWMNLTAACKACNSGKRNNELLIYMLHRLP
jgi:hypothetical protein